MRQVRTPPPLVMIWTHQVIDIPGKKKQPVFEMTWGENLRQVSEALARYLVDTRGDAVVFSYDAHSGSAAPNRPAQVRTE